MAGYSPAGSPPNFDFAFYYRSFVDEVQKNLKLYWQCKRQALPTKGPTIDFYSEGHPVGAVPVVEICNWETLASETAHHPNAKVETLVEFFGAEVASSVEFMIRQEAAKYGNHKDVRNLIVVDIFHRSDGSPNLNLNVVTNAPCSVADPAALIPGWVSYKFHFAVGFAGKGK